jgi:hypothetical protein
MPERGSSVRTARISVVDSFSLYSIATGHTPNGSLLRGSAEMGKNRLVASAVALAVTSSMDTCWDTTCKQRHVDEAATAVQELHESGLVEVVELSAADAAAVGRLYRQCQDHRIGGAEVLAACHSVLLVASLEALLVSTARARYCYLPLVESTAPHRIELI